jgi:hypothetical protein
MRLASVIFALFMVFSLSGCAAATLDSLALPVLLETAEPELEISAEAEISAEQQVTNENLPEGFFEHPDNQGFSWNNDHQLYERSEIIETEDGPTNMRVIVIPHSGATKESDIENNRFNVHPEFDLCSSDFVAGESGFCLMLATNQYTPIDIVGAKLNPEITSSQPALDQYLMLFQNTTELPPGSTFVMAHSHLDTVDLLNTTGWQRGKVDKRLLDKQGPVETVRHVYASYWTPTQNGAEDQQVWVVTTYINPRLQLQDYIGSEDWTPEFRELMTSFFGKSIAYEVVGNSAETLHFVQGRTGKPLFVLLDEAMRARYAKLNLYDLVFTTSVENSERSFLERHTKRR